MTPEVIAIQWLGDNLESVKKFIIMNKFGLSFEINDNCIWVEDCDGDCMTLHQGDWIFVDNSTWSGMSDDHFKRLYVEVEGDES